MKGSTQVILSVVCFIALQTHPISSSNHHSEEEKLNHGGKQTWGYVEVRPGAYTFWWLYFTTATPLYTSRPLVLWLQGGPGASSTGYGNFEEIGPLDLSLKNRTYNWVKYANVLFVDNPVGTGFSYVNHTKLLATNNSQIASDLLEMLTKFLEKVPEFQKTPLYIFSESYGGKMASQFALKLYKQIEKGKIKCNLKGVNLGDPWISPIDSLLTWGPFLYSTSMVDNPGFAAVNASAYAVNAALDKGQYKTATVLWGKTEMILEKETNGVDVYNILKTSKTNSFNLLHQTRLKNNQVPLSSLPLVNQILKTFHLLNLKKETSNKKYNLPPEDSPEITEAIRKISAKTMKKYHRDALSSLMNGKVKKMLRIIPKGVKWGGQSQKVFQALAQDFMKPVVGIVESLLNNTPIAVNVYSGQLDLIVDIMGTIKWVENMNWAGIKGWRKAPRKPVIINNSTEMFIKSFKNFGFYWILKAGHMVAADAPLTAVQMLKIITNLKETGE